MREIEFNVVKSKNLKTGIETDIPAIKGEGINYDAEIDQLADEIEELNNSKINKNDNNVEVGALSYHIADVIKGWEFNFAENDFDAGIPKNTEVALFSEENADRDWFLEWSDDGFTTGQSILLNLNGSPAIYNIKGVYSRNAYRFNDGTSNYDTVATMNSYRDYTWTYSLKKEKGTLEFHMRANGGEWGKVDLSTAFVVTKYSDETLWFGGKTDSAGVHSNVCDAHFYYARLKWLNEED